MRLLLSVDHSGSQSHTVSVNRSRPSEEVVDALAFEKLRCSSSCKINVENKSDKSYPRRSYFSPLPIKGGKAASSVVSSHLVTI